MIADPRSIFIDGAAGPIEVLLQEPDEGVVASGLAAVVAHPHPLHGGTLHNKVVHRTAKALRGAGVTTARFNFRGVGRSGGVHDSGRGEVDDFRRVADEVAKRYPAAGLVAAGFSFGSRVALVAGESDPRVVGVIGLGVPLRIYPDLAGILAGLTKPTLILQGSRDEFTTATELKMGIAHLGRPPLVFEVAGDHFFSEGLERIATIVPWFVGRLVNPRDSTDDRDPRL